MSATLLYRIQQVRVYRYQKTDYKKDSVEIHFSIPKEKCRCPACGYDIVRIKETRERTFIGTPLGGKKVLLVVKIPKIYCPHCHTIRQVHIPFARPNKHYTRAFEHYVLRLLKNMTVSAVAEHLGVSWDMIREIEQYYLEKHFAYPSLKGVRYIAIDEIASKKGHQYLTIVMNLENGQVLYVGDGRKEDALTGFWRRLKRNRVKIEAVATDMSRPFTKAIRENLHNAIHVFDHFHIIKMFNEIISRIRTNLYKKIRDRNEKMALKGTKYILLKRPENLDPSKGEPERLQKTLEANEDLSTVYYLKEELHSLWKEEKMEAAQGKIMDMIEFMVSSSIPYLKSFAKTLSSHIEGILAWFIYPISTGPLEGLNNKIKVIKRVAYGFRNMKYFKLKILAAHTN